MCIRLCAFWAFPRHGSFRFLASDPEFPQGNGGKSVPHTGPLWGWKDMVCIKVGTTVPLSMDWFSRSFPKCLDPPSFKKERWGLPWWLSGKESACQCRRHRLDPWSGKIPHATEQLIPCATTIEPVLLNLGVKTTEAHTPQSRCSAAREATTMRCRCTQLESSPRSPRLEKSLHSKKAQHSQKVKLFF